MTEGTLPPIGGDGDIANFPRAYLIIVIICKRPHAHGMEAVRYYMESCTIICQVLYIWRYSWHPEICQEFFICLICMEWDRKISMGALLYLYTKQSHNMAICSNWMIVCQPLWQQQPQKMVIKVEFWSRNICAIYTVVTWAITAGL